MGGVIDVKVVITPILLSEELGGEGDSSHGAINCFVGRVRAANMDRHVIGMEYDCFIPLCEKIFLDIANEAREMWCADANIFIVHRHGKLEVGDLSVMILATTRHRDESYRITRYIIEQIKIRAPIWKKEYYQDGETDWVRGHALCQHSSEEAYEHVGNYSCGR